MTNTISRRQLAAILAFAALPSPASAQSIPPAKIRLVEGLVAGKSWIAIELEVPQGWKTYWRSPGDSGVAPQFDWSGSQNIRVSDVLFPAPTRFPDSYGDTLGYGAGRLILPLLVEKSDASRPARLHLAFDYGLCSSICVPMRAESSLEIGSSGADSGAVIAASLARVPRVVPAGTAIKAMQVSERPNGYLVRMQASLAGGILHAAVEGPDDWRFSLPKRTGEAVFEFLAEYPAGQSGHPAGHAQPDARLRITLVGNADAVEESRSLR